MGYITSIKNPPQRRSLAVEASTGNPAIKLPASAMELNGEQTAGFWEAVRATVGEYPFKEVA